MPARHPRPGQEGRAVPPVRRRPVPGRARRPHRVGARRLHDERPVPVLPDLRRRGRAHDESFNYVRNSVKVTVDAYDGTIKFYVVDKKDPIIKAYRGGVPGAVHRRLARCPRRSARTCGTRRTCSGRRPTMYGRYHMTDPTTLLQQGRPWEVSPDPGSGGVASDRRSEATASGSARRRATSRRPRRRPARASTRSTCYIRLPGREGASSSSCVRSCRCRRATARTGSCRSWSRSPSRASTASSRRSRCRQGQTVDGPGAGEQHDHQTPAISQAVHAAQPAGLAGRAGQHAAHPDRGLARSTSGRSTCGSRRGQLPAFRFVVVFYAGLRRVLRTDRAGRRSTSSRAFQHRHHLHRRRAQPGGTGTGTTRPPTTTPPTTAPGSTATTTSPPGDHGRRRRAGTAQDLLDQAARQARPGAGRRSTSRPADLGVVPATSTTRPATLGTQASGSNAGVGSAADARPLRVAGSAPGLLLSA